MELKSDVAIIGGGPAGLTAAVYVLRAGFSAVIFEAGAPGGQMLLAHEIENYPGFSRISGMDLADAMTAQATALGADVLYASVDTIVPADGAFLVTAGGESYGFRAVIVATGTNHQHLNVPGEAEFLGRGVSYCAVCDGRFFKDMDVAVVGGGNTAVGDALYLSSFCRSVTLIHRRDSFRADRILVDRLAEHSNIRLLMNARVEKIEGSLRVDSLELISTAEDKLSARMSLPVQGVFIAVGNTPNLPAIDVPDGLPSDDGRYPIADNRCRTKVPGLFLAGDIRSKTLRQIATAVSDGAVAGVEAAEYLKSMPVQEATPV